MTVEFTATFSDVESNPFNYQWQYQDVFALAGDDIGDIANTVALQGDTIVSSWDGATRTLSEVLGIAVTDNSLQGFIVHTGSGVSEILSNTTDSITVSTVGGAIGLSIFAWFGARIYDNNYTNVSGETGSVLDFNFVEGPNDLTYDPAIQAESVVVGSNSITVSFDLGLLDNVVIDQINGWTIQSEATASPSTTSVPGTDRILTEHSIVNGVLEFVIVGGDFSALQGESLLATNTSNTFLGAINMRASVNNIGLYRCQVTAIEGDTTTVNSNEIELT